MVRKKKKREEETVTFCYYCDRIFADETTLIQHQKARHYKYAVTTACSPVETVKPVLLLSTCASSTGPEHLQMQHLPQEAQYNTRPGHPL